jgi:hypothetical protein
MLSIFAIYLIITGIVMAFIWFRLAARKRTERGLTSRDSLKFLAGALISWLLLAVVSGIIFLSFLSRMLMR